MRLLDNKAHGRVLDALAAALENCNEFSILTSEFSIFAFDALRKALGDVSQTKLLLANATQSITQDLQPGSILGGTEERSLRNTLEGPAIAKACAQWIESNVQLSRVDAPVPHSMYIASGTEKFCNGIQGSSTFTAAGLGLVPSPRLEMNTSLEGNDQVEGLSQFFDSLWSDPRITTDEKSAFIAQLRKIYEPKSPEQIYFAFLFALFSDSLEQLDEEQIVKSKTGIRDTLVWRKLYRFQRDGALGAIDKIERYSDCIIADSVGLGKTFEALAVIKYYELRNDRVLVLCPKRLRDNWTIYTVNDKRNIFAEDRFNYDVLNHTDLTRTCGKSGSINLKTLNWGNYDLVVIDESHNFRNTPSPKKEGLTRYKRLMNQIIKSGVKTRVLMLSATPVNNRMNDLKNQVAFITEGNDTALEAEGITSLEQTHRKAQTHFNQWLRLDEPERTTTSLLETLNFDYFKLLDLLTIARSRKHIEKYYDLTEIGKFPARLKPVNIRADIDTEGIFPALSEVNRALRTLSLSAYAPMRYVLPQKREEYSRKYDIEIEGGSSFRQLDREESLIHLMRVNLLKRMESSIHSFSLTLEKLLGKVDGLLERIEAHGDEEILERSIEDIDSESDEFDQFLVGAKVKVLLHDVDLIRWKQDLQEDQKILKALLQDGKKVTSKFDEKLHRLQELIGEKITNPKNPGNKKVLIFTAFADTAAYLYENIAEWLLKTYGVHTARVTGQSATNATTLKGIRTDQNAVLAAFAPISKERAMTSDQVTAEIDILIATDCISEGQNLQDCDFLVNYDIHWNPVRIIQRFGRIDRLGSKNDVIQLVNFWPNMELDEYINLEARVSGRMVLLDISATGEENIIESTPKEQMNDLDYRKKQLERLQEEVVDLEDLGGGISITDLTLNDFKMDLGNYLKDHQQELSALPLGAFSLAVDDQILADFDLEPGAFFCLRSESAKLGIDASYALASHFAVYVGDSGSVLLGYGQTRRVLEVLKKLSTQQPSLLASTYRQWTTKTKQGNNMSHYQELLGQAVVAITGKAEERGVESLFVRGGTSVSNASHKGLDDFEVEAFLAVLPGGAA